MTEKRTIDFSALTRGLLQDLRDAYSARPPREVERSEGSGITQVKEITARVQSDYDTRLEPVEAMYRERAESAADTLEQRHKRIEAYARRERRAVAADPKKFILAGRVLDASTGVGLPNVGVNAFDPTREHEAVLGSTHTDALGYFRIEYTAAQLQKLGERSRASVEVLDDRGRAIFTSEKALAPKLGSTAFVSARVEGNKVPKGRDLGKRIDESVSSWMQSIQRRMRVSKPRGGLPLGRLPGGARVSGAGAQPKRERRGAPPIGSARLQDVKGIGDKFASRLIEAGITTIGDVGEMDPDSLAKILDTTVNRAESILVEARRFARRR